MPEDPYLQKVIRLQNVQVDVLKHSACLHVCMSRLYEYKFIAVTSVLAC